MLNKYMGKEDTYIYLSRHIYKQKRNFKLVKTSASSVFPKEFINNLKEYN